MGFLLIIFTCILILALFILITALKVYLLMCRVRLLSAGLVAARYNYVSLPAVVSAEWTAEWKHDDCHP